MKLVVNNVSRGNGSKYVVNFTAAPDVPLGSDNNLVPVPPAPMGFAGGSNNLTLVLDHDEARKYFPGEEYTLTLKKA